MVVMLAAFTWTFWGRKRLRALAFPLVLLGAMVPLPAIVYNSMAAPLQLLASDLGANLAGWPASRSIGMATSCISPISL